MNRFVSTAACIVAAVSIFVGCQPKEKPDGKCEITEFSLKSALNPSLTSDVNGVIDASARTITLVIPASVTTDKFVVTFTATEWDAVAVGGENLVSGETSVSIKDGTKILVSDPVSVLQTDYTIVIKINDGTAELTSIVFRAADNSQLSEDLAPAEIGAEMLVRVPGSAFRQELVLTVTSGSGDAIKVNNQDVESGSSIKVDTNFPIDVVVTDEVAKKVSVYELKVGKILQYQVTKLASYTEGNIMDLSYIAFNEAENVPYIAYTRKLDGDKNNNASIAKWDGSNFVLVGTSGIADASARSASKPKVAFDANGTVYAFYLSGDVSNRPTIKKLDGEWILVGEPGVTPQNVNTSYYYPFFIHPANGRPSFFWNGNTKNTETYRTMCFGQYNGSWNCGLASGNFPPLGSDNSNGMYYTSFDVKVGEKVYIVSAYNQHGYYVHEVSGDGVLSSIVEEYLPGASDLGLPGNLQLAADGEGQLYVLAADRSAGIMQVYTVDEAGKILKPFGAGIPVEISSNGGISQDVAIAINPVDSQIFVVFDGEEGVPQFALLDTEGGYQWSAIAPEEPAVAAKSAYKTAFDKDGNGFVVYQSADGIEVYGIALEPDIIPE